MTSRRALPSVLSVLPVTLLALAACGGGEAVTERAIEEAARSEGVDVDVDVDGDGDGGMVIETEDGAIEVTEDGGMVIETEDGEIVSQQGQELPDDFPSVVPVLDGWEPTMSSRMVDAGSPSWFVIFAAEADPADTTEAVRAAMADAGFTETQSMESGSADDYTAFGGYEGNGYEVIVAVATDTTSGNGTAVTLTVTEATP